MGMEYKHMETQQPSSNWSGLLGYINGLQENMETVCSSTDFVVRHVIQPAVESTLLDLLKTCAPPSEQMIPAKWYLCTDSHQYNCDGIGNYTSQCKASRENVNCSTSTSAPHTDDVDSDAGVLLLVGLLIIGALLGATTTIAVCLICPATHRWANSKLGRDSSSGREKSRESAASDYYTAIDDKHNQTTLQLRPINATNLSRSHEQLNSTASGDSNDPSYRRPDVNQAHGDPMPNAAASHPVAAEQLVYGDQLTESYEPLSRNNANNQSHKYASIDPMSPTTPTDTEHSYFVLEKTNDQ